MKYIMLIACVAVAGGALLYAGSHRPSPVVVEYASYDDCILGKLGRGQSTVASEAIIAACGSKFGVTGAAATSARPDGWGKGGPIVVPAMSQAQDTPAVPPGENPYLSLVPQEQQAPVANGLPDDAALVEMWKERGYSCSLDCAGLEAGYRWAASNDLTDPETCDGDTQPFIDGCRAYFGSAM